MQNEKRPAPLEPRLIRPAPDPLGLYIRVGRNDHPELLNLISQGHPQYFGFVFEATLLKRHRELRECVLANRFDAILDPRTQPAATLGGHSSEIAALPWGSRVPHTQNDFTGAKGRRTAELLAECVVKHAFTEVLAPTHLLESSADDWFRIDCDSTRSLREQLDSHGGQDVQILYSLAISYATFRDPSERRMLIRELRQLPIDALWLRVEGLGANATVNGVRNYIEGASEFGALDVPIVADGMGGVAGQALLAFGAAGGLAHGVTFGERVDNASWRHARTGGGFGPTRRVYLPDLDLMMDPALAETFLHSSPRAHALFACRDTDCCRRGLRDMIEEPARHFLVQRMKQVARLGRVHLPLRADRFVEEQLRPLSDRVLQATNLRIQDEGLAEKLMAQRKRIDALRVSLGQVAREGVRKTVRTVLPKTRIAREHRTGPQP
jgi:hypothetical protein